MIKTTNQMIAKIRIRKSRKRKLKSKRRKRRMKSGTMMLFNKL